MAFPKFVWQKALLADKRFTPEQKLLGIAICNWFTRKDGTGWPIELDDIPKKMSEGMHHERLKVALTKFVRYGYLTEVKRSKGGRGVTSWRHHDLSKPAAVLLYLKQHGVKPEAVLCETRSTTVAGLPGNAQVTQHVSDLSVTSSVTSSGDARASADVSDRPPKSIPEEPPSKTCTDHPNWNDWPCIKCKRDKNAHQTWLADSRRLLKDLERQRDRATGTDESAAISHERRNRIAVFQRLGENWK
jgi:hypothetical protein